MSVKKYLHNPAHLFMDDAVYFITGATYQKQRFIIADGAKKLLLECMRKAFSDYGWELHHWVILDNHYHLLGRSDKGNDLPQLIKKIHAQSGFHIKRIADISGKVWWNYWDYCLRDENDYFRHLNYLFYNPIKHGYVTDLNDYPYSSFPDIMQQQGRAFLRNQFKHYADYKTLSLDDEF
ncbi:transposase [Methylomarinum sp. Ch1-1]|uniref:Transposase n=1 Tax=Methylomarinum roseum TaxID=3067653 RepID=A0AAU7NPR9_9GAMM|nr:transposase [Methylomarinum sp. Ch1-1]MDP4521114.1 transposase [Methylomarinum sp. Ch1-1]